MSLSPVEIAKQATSLRLSNDRILRDLERQDGLAIVTSKVGRPSSYKPVYCNEVIEFLAGGHSVTAFAGHIGVARSTVFKWAEEIIEFSDALKVGQAKATAFWERVLVKVASEGGGNATAAIFGLKNRAHDDWSDKVVNELTGKDGGAIQVDSLTTADRARALAAFINKTKAK